MTTLAAQTSGQTKTLMNPLPYARLSTIVHRRLNTHKRFIILSAILLFAYPFISPLAVHAQSPMSGTTPAGLAPGAGAGTYSLSGFDNVNFYNGNLNFSLPVLQVGGRGRAQIPILIRIEQQWWTETVCNEPNNCWAEPRYKSWLGEPDKAALEYIPGSLSVRYAGEGNHYEPCPGFIDPVANFVTSLTRMTFKAPDGTEYELRDQLTGGEPASLQACATTGASRGKVFVTADGTSATFISDEEIKDAYRAEDAGIGGATGYLMLRDGTRYRIEYGGIKWMRDRNGNMINFNLPAGTGSNKIVDSLNREVVFTQNIQDGGDASHDEISYKGFQGQPRLIRIEYKSLANVLRTGYTIKTYKQLFPALNGSAYSQHNPTKISAIVLPDGRNYKFRYNSHGELARVELPTGGAYEYDFDFGFDNRSGGARPETEGTYRRLVERRVYEDGVNQTSRMTISKPEYVNSCLACNPQNEGYVEVDHYDGTTLLKRERHYYYGSAYASISSAGPTRYSNWREGKEYMMELYDSDGTTLLRQVQYEWQQKANVPWFTQLKHCASVGCSPDNEPANDPRIVGTVTTLSDTNQMSRQVTSYDQFNNPIDVWEYDYGEGAAGKLLRHTHTDYMTTDETTGVNYVDRSINGPHLLGLVKEQIIHGVDQNGVEQSTPAAKTRFYYDQSVLVNRPDISGLVPAFTTGYIARGNVTRISRWLNTDNTWIDTDQEYDIAGNITKITDPLTRQTTFDYSDRFGKPEDDEARGNTIPQQLNGKTTYAFMTSATNALGQTTYAQYDYYHGGIVNAEDLNGVVTSRYYNDPLGRSTKGVSAANNAARQAQTIISYDDVNRTITVTSDLNGFNDQLLKSQTLYDGLGRTVESRRYENVTAYVTTRQIYDSLGRIKKVSNPYRMGDSIYWTTNTYDVIGRITEVTMPDGTVLNTNYNGDQTFVTDQAGKKRLSRADSFGRLTDVWEITSPDANTMAVSFKNQSLIGYHTQYEYDALGNLRTAIQGTQTRSFVYDSLSRQILARNPEQNATLTDSRATGLWSMSYQYDKNSNLWKKTDARSITTIFTYDEINRVTSKSYQNDTMGTPSITYFYDNQALPAGAPDFDRGASKGRLVAITYGGSRAGTYQAYDIVGQVSMSIQVTDARAVGQSEPNWQTYTFSLYSYDLAGNLTRQVYPSGREVGTNYDDAGRVSRVWGNAPSNCPIGWNCAQSTHVYADSFSYAAHGAVSAMMLGNGLWERTKFNSRLQLEEIKLGTSAIDVQPSSGDRLKLNYSYGSTDNNGTLRGQTITIPTIGSRTGFTVTQGYTYDHLNRLESAQEQNGTTMLWKQKFTYDRYGNRNFNTSETTIPAPLVNLTIKQENNRFDPAALGQSNIRYDATGNLDRDASGQNYAYDAENRQVNYNNGQASYVYDGDGKRVKKTVGVTTTIFVYNAMGQMVAEYSDSIQNSSNGTSYVSEDYLGSARLITGTDINDSTGGVKERHDYLPFGDELYADNQVRTAANGYEKDTLRQKFTQKERDSETGLDYFGARYYSSAQGRFTSVDPSGKSIKRINPQTWNRYTYCLNSPLEYIDSNGKWPSETHDKILATAFTGLNQSQLASMQSGSRSVDITGLNPKTLWEKNAHQHAMTPGSKVRELGSEAAAREWAKSEANAFINSKMENAKSAYAGTGRTEKGETYRELSFVIAMYTFGEGAHTIMDSFSPAHRDFQVYDTGQYILGYDLISLGGGLGFFAADMLDHSITESRQPTEEEMNDMVDALRLRYRASFGEDAYNRAVLEEDRIKTEERQKERERRKNGE